VFPRDAADPTTLLQQADSAMYAAKSSGKNQVRWFTPDLRSSVRERLSLDNELRGAIARKEIHLYYQPEFEVSTQRLRRFEALARWTHRTLGVIPPAKFIPVAEESGQIVALGAYLMEQACSEAVKWQTPDGRPIQVAVNVSSLQFKRPTFVDEVTAILNRTGLRPELLQIELTESIMLTGIERAAATMNRLRGLGVSLAIDDFGTGYSCLSYLPRLPFDTLKIDRSFVRELESNSGVQAIVSLLVSLAHSLNMQVVVEGVQTKRQLEMIRELNGNEVQGFLLGRPTPDPQSVIRTGENVDQFSEDVMSAAEEIPLRAP
jgi:EAL domain-containing protein (putative c-di-GMP-specific phosphodiesterase class I)